MIPDLDGVATKWHFLSVPKKDVTVRMRVAASEVKRWKTAARRAKRTLSDWMRLKLSNARLDEPPAQPAAGRDRRGMP